MSLHPKPDPRALPTTPTKKGSVHPNSPTTDMHKGGEGGKDHGGGGRPASAGPCMDRSRRCQRYQKPLRMGPRKRQGADNNVAGLCKPSDLLQVRRSSSSKRRTKKAEPLRNAMSFPRFGSCLHPVTPGRGSSRPMSGQLARGNAASLFF